MRSFAQKQDKPQKQISSGFTRSHTARFGTIPHTHHLLPLQQTIGSQAEQRILLNKGQDAGVKHHHHLSLLPIHDFNRIPVHAAIRAETLPAKGFVNQRLKIPIAQSPGLTTASTQVHSSSNLAKTLSSPAFSSIAEPVSNGSLVELEEPLGEFNEEEAELGMSPVPLAEETETIQTGAETTTATLVPQAAAGLRTVIRGPREMWNFNGETPAGYTVSSRLSTNRTGGTFRWSVSPQLTLSSAADPTPTVTTVTSSNARRDAWIRVRHTDAAGVRTVASYHLTVLAPKSLTHLRNVDGADATWGYLTEIHYSIHDQLGTVLPRNVPINEQWTGPVVADFAGMNWPRGAEGAATVQPVDWHDRVGGVGAGGVPAPVDPGHADAGVAICHWTGDWRVGSLTIGNGSRVSSVTWQRNRGFARHT